MLCRYSGSQGEREKVVFSCRQVEVRVFCNHTLKGQREIKRNKKKFTTSEDKKNTFSHSRCWLITP